MLISIVRNVEYQLVSVFSEDLKELQLKIDEKLTEISRTRTFIRGDGHCLPRAVFCGCKLKGLLEQCVKYKRKLNKTG